MRPANRSGHHCPVKLGLSALLRVHLLHLIARSIIRHIPLNVRDITLGRKRMARHVVCHAIGLPCDMAVFHWSAQDPLGMLF